MGATIIIGHTGDDLCLVSAVLAFMVICPDTPDSLFVRADGFPLSWEFLVNSIRQALAAVGVDTASYNGHSFWIGEASAAALAGFPTHSSNLRGAGSRLHYILIPMERLKNVSSVLSGRIAKQACMYSDRAVTPKTHLTHSCRPGATAESGGAY